MNLYRVSSLDGKSTVMPLKSWHFVEWGWSWVQWKCLQWKTTGQQIQDMTKLQMVCKSRDTNVYPGCSTFKIAWALIPVYENWAWEPVLNRWDYGFVQRQNTGRLQRYLPSKPKKWEFCVSWCLWLCRWLGAAMAQVVEQSSFSLHVQLSLGKILNPKLPLMYNRCMNVWVGGKCWMCRKKTHKKTLYECTCEWVNLVTV